MTNTRHKLSLLSVATLFCSNPFTQAELIWPKTEKTVQTSSTDNDITVTFEAINTGNIPIEITNIEKSCGCTEVTPSKSKLQKGDETKLQVVITPPPIGGKQDKQITIQTSDGKAQILTVHLDMPETFTLSAHTQDWTHDLEPKTLKIELKPNTTFLKAESLSPDFMVTNEQPLPNQILVTIKPTPQNKQTNKTAGTLRLQFAFKGKPFYHYLPLKTQTSDQEPKTLPINATKSERIKHIQTELQKLQFQISNLTQDFIELTKEDPETKSK